MKKQLFAFSALCFLASHSAVHASDPQSPVSGSNTKKLMISSVDDKFKLSFNGRIQTDGAMFFGEDYQPLGNGVGFRRVRLGATAVFGDNLSGMMEVDFTDGGFSLKDCFIKYDLTKELSFKGGNVKEAFSMDAMTSSGDFLFMEEANVTSTFAPEYHIGLQANWQKKHFIGSAGVYFKKINGTKEKDYSDANNKAGQDEGISYTGRVVWIPLSESKDGGFHLGAAASYRTPKTTVGSLMPNTVRYSTTSLSYINKIKFLDTAPITKVNHDLLLGTELAGFYKAFRMQGEYILNKTYRNEGLAIENFNGFYIQAAYLLFGGHQKYNASRATFVQPSAGKSWGDIELAARFDRIDLNATDVKGGSANGWTFGVNYYATHHFKIQLNYSYVDHDKYANAFGSAAVGYNENGEIAYTASEVDESQGKGGNAYGILGVRLQLSF